MSEANQVAIKVENLTKVYKLYNKASDRLKEALNPLRKKYHQDFYALRDINFEILKGQTVGIIGKNGSGKSTLLKILTGVLTPTAGKVTVNGKIAALLELGAGFNPELTGYENIFFNGSLMGFTKEEMEQKVPEILEFADIGEFIHQPVKMYSSGMFARLAFAVAINVEPDILIVDEALSVGDVFFQAKCYQKFRSFQEAGRTVLFVTHSLDTIVRHCTTAICLNEGAIVFSGSPFAAVDFYKKINSKSSGNIENLEKIKKEDNCSSFYIANNSSDSYGSHEAEIVDYAICDQTGNPENSFEQGEAVSIYLKVSCQSSLKSLIAAFAIKTPDGVEVVGANSSLLNLDLSQILTKGSGEIRFHFPLDIRAGEYLLSLGLTYYDDSGDLRVCHRLYNIISLMVIEKNNGTGLFVPQIETIVSV